ncbi:zona pellucida protein C [Stigmatopora argus]
MAALEVIWCAFLGHFLLFHWAQTASFLNVRPLPYEISSDFISFDTIVNPWRVRVPDFGPRIPAVQVYCDESELILLVDKRLGEFTLNRAEIKLGDGCYSNSELPNQLMFTYGYDQCGTNHEVRNGLDVFSNSLHVSPRKGSNMEMAPSSVHVVCIPDRHGSKVLNLPPQRLPDKSRKFNLQAMDSSWTSVAESNTYTRGQLLNLQVSAPVQPDEQLFIQSCFFSSFPDALAKPRHAIIMNKGCTVPSGSPFTFIKFLDSDNSVVNFVLNSSYLIEEVYVHCSVLISDIGITSGSKSCNFDLVNSRWEELSGNVEVCRCCNSKCKGLSDNNLPQGAKAVISTGPLFIVNKPSKPIPESLDKTLDYMQSDAATLENDTSADSELGLSNAVVVVKRDPISSLTLVLPASNEENDIAQSNEWKSPVVEWKTKPNDDKGQSSNLPSSPPQQTEVRDEPRPVLRSKILLSKNADGSQTLSYEEAVTLFNGGAIGTLGNAETECKRKRERRLHSIFLNLLRRMDKIE